MSTSLESFITVLKRSGLVDDAALGEDLATLREHHEEVSAEQFAHYLTAKHALTSWQASKLLQGKHKGFFLGKYKLLRLLGKGGMSSVYLAEHVLMKRRCAIKVLPWKFVKDSSYLERFHREAQAVAALDHPNIVRAYDIDHEKDGSVEINFLVMEYVEGENLYELVQKGGPLEPQRAAEYIRQGALGLAHAHEAGMVHRDVKPGNFIVDQNGTVKLMDLGLARVEQDDEHSLTVAHDERVLGTADYLAPEQAVDSHTVDHRADLYSLGCTLYFLLTGKPPFHEGTLAQRLLAHQTKEPPSITQFRSDVPEPLVEILRRLMVKDRDHRFQSATEVVEAIDAWRNSGVLSLEKRNPPTSDVPEPIRAELNRETPRPQNQSTEKAPKPSTASGSLGDFLSNLDSNESSFTKKQEPRRGLDSKTPVVPTKQSEPLVSASVLSDVKREPLTGTSGSDTKSSKVAESSKRRLGNTVGNLRGNPKAIAFAGIALLGILAVGYLLSSDKSSPEKGSVGEGGKVSPSVPDVPKRPAVDGPIVQVSPEGHFGTLGDAIRYLTENAFSSNPVKEIQVAGGQTLVGSVVIDNSGFGTSLKDFKIVGIGAERPILKSNGDGPALLLNDAEGVAIENLIIDCEGADVGVEVTGYLSGVRLTNLVFRSVSGNALVGKGISGLFGRQFVLENCRMEGISEKATLVRMLPSDDLNCRQILVRNCQFLGPGNAGLLIEGPLEEFEIRESIFHGLRDDIRFSGSEQTLSKVAIANNTFHQYTRGVAFESGPTSDSRAISLTQNLFVNGKGTAVQVSRESVTVEELAKGSIPSQNNWTDGTPNEGGTTLNVFANSGQTGQAVEFVSIDPASPAFLKPKTAAVRAFVKQPVGPRNYAGAVAP